MTDEMIDKNKEALLQEIGGGISESVEALSAVITTSTETPEDKIEVLYSSLMMLSQNLGYMAACYNQLMIFQNGSLPDTGDKSIGFKAMADDIEDKKEK